MNQPPPDDRRDPAAAPPAARVRQIRRQLMERVADTDTSHRTVPVAATDAAGDAASGWQPFLPGVHIKVLREHEGTLSYLLRLQPGAELPAHRHPRDEECVVLAGHLSVGPALELGPGDYHLAHAGALHGRIRSRTGATIFLRGAVPEADHVLC